MKTHATLFLVLILMCLQAVNAADGPEAVYEEYRARVGNFQSADDFSPYWSESSVKKMKALPLAALKFFMATEKHTRNLKLLKKKIEGEKATLTYRADADDKEVTIVAHLLREGGSWKIGKSRVRASISN